MKWGGEGSQGWEGRERRPNFQRALEDGHCASEEEQGQEGKYCAKSEDWSKGDAGKGKKEKDREKVKEIGLDRPWRKQMIVAKGRKTKQKN